MIALIPTPSVASSPGGATPGPIRIRLAIATPDAATVCRSGEPVTIGIPFPAGACANTERLSLIDPAGAPRPLQARALERWLDGSVKWALLDFCADAGDRDQGVGYDLVVNRSPVRVAVDPGVTVTREGEAVIVQTGTARFSIGRTGSFPFDGVEAGGHSVIDACRSGLMFEDSAGRPRNAIIERVDVEERGPLRSVVRCEGRVPGLAAGASLDVVARLHFFAGSATVRFVLTIRNPRRADHPGGRWALGGRRSVYLRDVSLRFTLAGPTEPPSVRCSPERGAPYAESGAPFELYQDSSGGSAWQSLNHRNRDGAVPSRFRGYRMRAGRVAEVGGLRASPVVTLQRGCSSLTIAMPYFWQNFPKALEAGSDSLTFGLFPREYADLHEIQGGEQKTHVFFVAFGGDRVTTVPLDWCRAPILARADPSWYCATGAVPYLVPAADAPDRQYASLVNAAIEGEDTFERKREAVDEYGWRHFGDVHADHEAVFERGVSPLISHYNNQYDVIAGCAYQFLRSADSRWWTLMNELAAHVTDIDVYHTSEDKAAYNHGLFWHTYHYVDAGTSSHRSYPRHAKVAGGGPSAEHNYNTGLLLHYLLTGDPLSRETAIDLARWVVAMDDGRRSIFRWFDRGATGLASSSGSPLYHGPGRGAANSIAALLNGHRLIGDPVLLAKAEALIRRCIHPADDLAARNLLDAERRWYYTVFLQALGRYLDYKAELAELDDKYAYARASLLHYAAWMADHEYPYLDRPGILEHPTETWAAQDMRKSEVFEFAARHSLGEVRSRYLECSDFFFQASVSQLSRMPTRTLTRPVALMLVTGFMHAWFARARDISAPGPPAGPCDFGSPEIFVPQKVRALRRVKRAAVGGLAAIVIALIYLTLSGADIIGKP